MAETLYTCGDWEIHTDEQGYEFFFNTQTGESQWEKPDDWTIPLPGEEIIDESGWTKEEEDSYQQNNTLSNTTDTTTTPSSINDAINELKNSTLESVDEALGVGAVFRRRESVKILEEAQGGTSLVDLFVYSSGPDLTTTNPSATPQLNEQKSNELMNNIKQEQEYKQTQRQQQFEQNIPSQAQQQQAFLSAQSSLQKETINREQWVRFEKIRKEAVVKFNVKPKTAIPYLIENNIINDTPSDLALFLRLSDGLSKRKMGEHFGNLSDYNQECLKEFLKLFDFTNKGLDQALRELMRAFRLPGEAQQIDRILEKFASRFSEQNPGIFSSVDTAYVLSFSLIMLNTDLHNENIAANKKMTLEGFISNNRGINQGDDLPEDYLRQLYTRIKNDEIRMNEGDMYESEVVTFIAPKMNGWLNKKSEGVFGQWKKHWFVLNDHCLYYFANPGDKDPRCIIPLDNARVGRGKSEKDLVITSADGTTVKSVKVLPGGKMEQGSHAQFLLRANNEGEREQWVVTLQSELDRSPIVNIMKRRTAKAKGGNVPRELPPPSAQGWMRKRGEVNTAWKKRWFVLFPAFTGFEEEGSTLYYYADKKAAQRMIDLGEDTHKGGVSLKEVERIDIRQNGPKDSAIELVTPDRIWIFGPQAEAFEFWLNLISDHVRASVQGILPTAEQNKLDQGLI